MLPDRALERLQEHHRQISAVLQEAGSHLQVGDATHFKALALTRWQLLRHLREYQLFKHIELFDPMIAIGPDDKRDQATRLKKRCVALGDKVSEHVQRWALNGPASSWPDYRKDALMLVEELRRHLKEERLGVERLLQGVKRTRTG